MKTITSTLFAFIVLSLTQARAETATNIINGTTNNVSGSYYVGNTGPFNALIITNAGILYGSSISYLGYNVGSSNNTALVTGTDSTWTNSNLVVGYSGAANQLNIENGGLVFAAMDYVGYSASSTGNTILVTGSNSRFVSSSDLQFGVSGGGNQMTISGGGLVNVVGTGYIGYNGGSSNNAVLVTGNNSVWSNASLVVGLGSSGNSLTITNGGAVSVSANTLIGSYAGTANNSLNLNGGTFTAGGLLEVRNGAVNINGGNLTTVGMLLVTNNTASATNAFFNFNYGTLTTAGAQLTAPSGGAIAIGNTAGQTANWNMLGGTHTVTGHAALGNAAGASANVLVTGPSTVWNNSGNLYAGYASGANNSTLTITNGAQVKNTDGYVGFASGASNNTVLVNGSGSVWTNTGALYLGYGTNANNNRLNIQNGAQVSGLNGTIGLDGANNSVLITDSNSQWYLDWNGGTDGNFVVGDRTSGNQVTVTNGGVLYTDSQVNQIIGNSSAANSNAVLVTGSSSKFTSRSDGNRTYIGMSGSGNSVVVRDGGSATRLGQVAVGQNSTANNNSIVVDGGMAGSVGEFYIGYDGSGNSLTITDGGNYTNYTAGVSSPRMHIGYNAGSSNNSVTVTGPGSKLAVSSYSAGNRMWVGESGSSNSLTVVAGGEVSVANWGPHIICLFSIGKNAGANNNAVTVTGSNSLLVVGGDVYVGESGSGNSLTIANGGVVSNSLGRYIGFNANSANNAVTITGAGSQWINTNNLYVGYGIGASGNQLTISNGGQLTNLPALYVGYGSGASNSLVTVSSGSLLQISSGVDIGNGGGNNTILVTGSNSVWNNGGALTIGSGSGGNQFTVSDGGAVSNASTSVGNGGGNDSLLVTDNNSVWYDSGDMVIGNGTSGNSLTISNGAQVVTVGKNVIGNGFGANNNSVLVTGGGSVWTNASDLNVGASGQNNSLTISNGALVANAGIGYTSFGGGSGNSVLVTGSNSTWNVGSWLELGGNNDQLTLSGTGAVVRVSSDMIIYGQGYQLTVSNGGQLFDTNFRAQNDSARILVTGSGSVWTNSGTFSFRRSWSDNQMTIAQGGAVFNGSATIGGTSANNYDNYVLVTDAGSQWNIAGDLTIFGAHDQGLTVTNSGAAFITGNINIGTNGDQRVAITVADGSLIATNAGAGILRLNSGELNLNGGTLNVNQLNATNSAVNLNSGTLTTYGVQIVAADGSNLAIGNTAGQTATVNILGGTNSIAPPSGYNTVLGSVAGAQANLLVTGPSTILTNTGNLYLGFAAGANNSQLTVTNGAQLINNNVLIVGYNGSGNQLAIQDGGKVDNGFFGFVGYNASASNNSVLVTGPGSFWNNRSDLKLGASGSGNQVTIANGGSVRVAGTTYVGHDASASNNAILVTGSGSTWTNTSTFYVGFNGVGNSLTVSNSGFLATVSFTYIGHNTGANNNSVLITGPGSTWNAKGGIYVGENGSSNSLTISQGGCLEMLSGRFTYIGANSNANYNSVLVTGASTLWNARDAVFVGFYGAGNQMTISDGAQVTNTIDTDASAIGYYASASNNSLVVTGAGSSFNMVNSLYSWVRLYVGASGPGNSLTVSDGGQMILTNATLAELELGGSSGANNNTLTVTGTNSLLALQAPQGNLYIGYASTGNQMAVSYGGTVSNTTGYIGYNSTANNNAVTVHGTGALWNNSGNLYIGYGTNSSGNSLSITNGGHVVNAEGDIGYNTGANNNRVLVSDTNSIWSNNGKVLVGYYGAGNSLIVSNGGLVTASGYVQNGFGNTNNLILVTGPGSALKSAQGLYANNPMTIADGGLVVNTEGHVDGLNNSVLVTGSGSVWSNSSTLSIGHFYAFNQLTITNGGAVYNTSAILGDDNDNAGVLVTGSGSVWNNSANLTVGTTGSSNTVNIANGGAVFAANATIGNAAGANNNSALVTGSGSVWSNSGSLTVGDTGSGNSLTISNSGAVVVGGNAYIGLNAGANNNQITVAGGSLAVTNAGTTGTLNVLRGALNFNGGTISADSLIATNGGNSVVQFTAGTLRIGAATVANGSTFTVGAGASAAALNLRGGNSSFANGLVIANNAALTGNGTIGTGNVQIQSGGTLAPGNSIGTLVFSNNLTLAGALNIELDNLPGAVGTGDFVNVVGQLNLTGGTLNIIPLSALTNSLYVFGQYGSLTGNFAVTNLPSGYTLDTNYQGNKEIALQAIAVPEPSSLLLVALGGLALFVCRRCR